MFAAIWIGKGGTVGARAMQVGIQFNLYEFVQEPLQCKLKASG